MKKKIAVFFMGICSAALIVGCSQSISNDKIKISQYKGIEIEKIDSVKVLDEHVDASISSTLEARGTEKEITDRPVNPGDVATISYVGKKDGEAFEGGSAENFPLTIGSGQFIDGFEDGIVGHNVGDTFDLNLTFPKDYDNQELAGQPVVFTVTVHKIAERVIPELTDELVTELSETSKTVEEYRKEVAEDLKLSNEESAKSRMEQNVWAALIEKCTVKNMPEDKKKEVVDSITTQYGSVAQMYGEEDVDAFVKQMFGVGIEKMAEDTITQEYAVELISEKENLKISDKEYQERLKKYAAQFGYEDEAQLEEAIGKEQLQKAMLQEKVTEFLIDNCKEIKK